MEELRTYIIDRTNFYINDIKYTATCGDLVVTGYDPAFFKGAAKIIPVFEYEGRTMYVNGIADDAFKNCTVLTSVIIPESINSIGENAFSGCINLNTVTIYSKSILSDLSDSVRSMQSIFGGQVQNYIIGDTITRIGVYTFYNCINLVSVKIPKSVTEIGYHAFRGCKNLVDINIPESVSNIEEGALEETSWLDNQPNGLLYAGRVAYKYIGKMAEKSHIIIKDGTTSIGDSAFNNCKGMSSIYIPNSVKSIGNCAFAGCNNLKDIIIPDSVDYIGYSVFHNCNKLASITLPKSVKSMYVSFSGCEELTSIKLPDGVKIIDEWAFNDCKSLTDIIIPDTVTRIGEVAFGNCGNLININFPESLTSIGWAAFSGCSKLTDINLPDNLTTIEGSAFVGCCSLPMITLPKNLKEMGLFVFNACGNLKIIVCTAKTPPQVEEIDCGNYENEGLLERHLQLRTTLVIPKCSEKEYKDSYFWKDFEDIEAIM